jgi:hypothetical protein
MTDIPHDHLGRPDLQALVRQCGGFDKISLAPTLGSSWEYAQMAATFRKGFGETGLLIVVLALVKFLSPPGDLSGQLICGPIEA